MWRVALLLAVATQLGNSSNAPAGGSEMASPKGKALGQHIMFAGRNVQRYVPLEYLPQDDTVEYVCEVQYRLIGPNVSHKNKELASLLDVIYAKFNAIAYFHIKLVLRDGPRIPGTSDVSCPEDVDRDECFLQSFKNAEHYRSMDLSVITGVSRATHFPDIGEKEWTYNRMIETALRDKGFVTRVITRQLTIYPDKVHIMKHIPLTPLYAEETVFQLEARELLPFNLAKQNLLLASLDCIGLNNLLGVGWLDVTSVTQAWHWNTSRVDDMGTANITMVTMRDKVRSSMGEALTQALPRLLDRLDEVGLPRVSGRVLSSKPLEGYTPHDQIVKYAGQENTVKDFDLRDPEADIRIYPEPPPPQQMITLATLLTIICITSVSLYALVYWRQDNRRHRVPMSPFQQSDTVFFGHTLDGLRGRPIVPPSGIERRSSNTSQGDNSSKSGTPNTMNPFRQARLMKLPSNLASSADINALGDSATETAGLEGISIARRRATIRSELEKATSLKGWEIDPSSIEICIADDGTDCLLGEGGFGQVYKGLRGGVQDVAVKVMTYSEELEAQRFWVEINLLKSLSFDRNIVQFYGCVLDESHPMLILELMEGGNLYSALNGPEKEKYLWYANGQSLAMDIVRGIFYLHDNRVIHGDLKSKNVLLTKNGANAKLSDVGMSRVLGTTLNTSGFSPPGTFAYAAPELILGQRCTFKADIFSLGVTLWEICTQRAPRRGHNRDLQVPEDCPEAISQLIYKCMEADPVDRPTIKEVFDILKANQTVPSRDPSNELRKCSASSLSQELRPLYRQRS